MDEAARVDDGLYYATRPMLAVSGGALIMLSSPAGRRGVFFEEWTEGAGWDRYEVPAEECPRIGVLGARTNASMSAATLLLY